MWKLLSRLAPPGTLSVLMFHRVSAQVDPMMPDEPTAQSFDRMLGWLQGQTTLLPLDVAVQRLRDGTLPPGAAAITFDDGYRDNVEVAAPLLARRGIPATFFIASGFLDGGIMWNDVVAEAVRRCPADLLHVPELLLPPFHLRSWDERGSAVTQVLRGIKYLPLSQRAQAVEAVARASRAALPTDLMMTSTQLRGLAAQGFTIGAHTVNHPILSQMPDAAARDEIVDGRNQLETLLDRRVGLFAYPNGRVNADFNERHVKMVGEAGFDAAFSTEVAICHATDNRFALPRCTPWNRRIERSFRTQLLRNQWRRLPRPSMVE